MSKNIKILLGGFGAVAVVMVGWWFIDGRYRFQDREVSEEERSFREAVMQEIDGEMESMDPQSDSPAADVATESDSSETEDSVETTQESQKTQTQEPTVLRSGSFTRIDAIHSGSGEARILSTSQGEALVLSDDFSVTNGPDLYVYLSKNSNISSSSELGEFTSLGLLESIEGRQVYSLPENFNEYESVVIWCKAYGVLFSSAQLN